MLKRNKQCWYRDVDQLIELAESFHALWVSDVVLIKCGSIDADPQKVKAVTPAGVRAMFRMELTSRKGQFRVLLEQISFCLVDESVHQTLEDPERLWISA